MLLLFVSPCDPGVYIVFSDNKGDLYRMLLAVRRFRPSPNLHDRGLRGSKVVKEWLVSVLEEFSIDYQTHALISNTDAGPDIKKLATKLLLRRTGHLLAAKLGDRVVSHHQTIS